MKYIITFITLLTIPCYSDSISVNQGPYYGINHTEFNYSTLGISYSTKIAEKWSVSPEVVYFSEVKTDYQMITLSSIFKYNISDKLYGLFGGGVAFIDYDAESEGNMLFNLECGLGIEHKFNSVGVFGEYRIKHQSNGFTGDNLGQDLHGFNIGINYYF